MGAHIVARKKGNSFKIGIIADKLYVNDEDISGYTFLYIDKHTGEVWGFRGRTGTSEFVPLSEAIEIVKRALLRLV